MWGNVDTIYWEELFSFSIKAEVGNFYKNVF